MKRWFIAIVALQICFVLGEAAMYQTRLQQGQKVFLKVEPVDPRSLFEGHYMALGYDISRWDNLAKHAPHGRRAGEDIWVGLEPERPYARVVSVSFDRPTVEPGIVYLRGVYAQPWGRSNVAYGIERYYIPEVREKDAAELWNRMRDRRAIVSAEISVDGHGRALVKGLYENGKPLGY
jgi:uncharacterized membrane-anchored protein